MTNAQDDQTDKASELKMAKWNVNRSRLAFGMYAVCGIGSVAFGVYQINISRGIIERFVPFVEPEKLEMAADQLTTYTGNAPAEVLAGVEAVVKDNAGKNQKFSNEYALVEEYIGDMLSRGLSDIKDPLFYQSEFEATAGMLERIAAHSTDKQVAEKNLRNSLLFTGAIGLGYIGLTAHEIYQFRKIKQELKEIEQKQGIVE